MEDPDADGRQCAAVLDGGIDDITPVRIWDAVMKKYKLAQKCDQELARLNSQGDGSKRDELLREKAVAIAAAVDALAKLQHKETLAKLQQIAQQDSSTNTPLQIGHTSDFLNNRNPLFWCSCFMRLFPRGDCAERSPARLQLLPSWRWAKCLLTRADFPLWRLDVEFVASLYNVFLRRDQVGAVEAAIRGSRFTAAQLDNIRKITATGLVAHALSSGDVNSVQTSLSQRSDLALVRGSACSLLGINMKVPSAGPAEGLKINRF